jgi:pimeloyl-ACP methyl ester carboxylesterase
VNTRRSKNPTNNAPGSEALVRLSEIAAIRQGSGPEVLLVHGGASPSTTWSPLAPLGHRWTLVVAHRRGYPPSPPPPEGHQDFLIDAADLGPLLAGHPHVVAHSYGGLGAFIAATQDPQLVRSLTLIEPAFYLLPDDPDVAHFKRLGDAVLTYGLDTDPGALREFLAVAGAPVDDRAPLPADVVRGVRRAQGSRRPGEADLAFEVIRDSDVPCLVVSGGHTPAIERICDALASELRAERLIITGAGHFVPAAPQFVERLEEFLLSADPRIT